jgi:hypothetical protein
MVGGCAMDFALMAIADAERPKSGELFDTPENAWTKPAVWRGHAFENGGGI